MSKTSVDELLQRIIDGLYISDAFPSNSCKAVGERVLRNSGIATFIEAGDACRQEAYRLSAVTPACVYEYDAAREQIGKPKEPSK